MRIAYQAHPAREWSPDSLIAGQLPDERRGTTSLSGKLQEKSGAQATILSYLPNIGEARKPVFRVFSCAER